MIFTTSSSLHFNKRLSILCAAACIALPQFAEIVSPTTALSIARQYIDVKAKDKQLVRTLSTQQHSKKHAAKPLPYYLFNDAHGKGFVLVAGDDAMGEVLAYSQENALDTTIAHPGLHYMLEGYRTNFATLQHYKTARLRARTAAASGAQGKAVAPLLQTKWNQMEPYNAMLGKAGSTPYPYTGCVATAVAQIMKYHNWPVQGVGTHEYTVPYYQDRLQVDFQQSHYDWNNMINDYTQGSTEAQRNAVAKLMSDVGVAMNMGYTPWYSGAFGWQAKDALVKHFQYDAVIISKVSEGNDAFLKLVQQEIRDGFPVYLDGSPSLGNNGHAWVADGLDEKGLVHMNFGWGGLANAYFSLESLSLSQAGAEFGGKPLSFSKNMNAILAHPHKGGVNTLPSAYRNTDIQIAGKRETTMRLPEGAARQQEKTTNLDVVFQHFINKGNAFEGRVGLAIYNAQQQMVGTPQWYDKKISFQQSDQINQDRIQLSFNTSDLTDGTYFVAPVVQPAKDENTDNYYPIRNVPQLEFEITANKRYVINEFYYGAGYAWNGKLWSEKSLRVGTTQTIFCPIRTLQGDYRVGSLIFSLVDKAGKIVLTQTLQNIVDHDEFTTKNVPVPVNIPDNFTPGTYDVKAQVQVNDGLLYDVLPSHDGTLPEVVVKENNPAEMTLPKVTLTLIFSKNADASLTASTTKRNLTFGTDDHLVFAIQADKTNGFNGRLKYYLEEESTKVRIPLGNDASAENANIQANATFSSQEIPLRIAQLKVRNDQHYRVVIVQDLGNGEQRELPFGENAQREFEFTNARSNAPEMVYVPAEKDFFVLTLPHQSAYVVAPSPQHVENSTLSSATTAQDGEAKNNIRAIFYRINNKIISLSTGRVLQLDTEEINWTKALTFAPYSNEGSELQWVQQDRQIRLRGVAENNVALSTPMVAERVEVLPINIAQHGYATFFTPVQGRIENAKAYRAVKEGEDRLSLREIQGEIPANTAFIVEGTPNGQAQFRISASTTPTATPFKETENVLHGSVIVPAQNNSVTFYALSGDEKAFYRLETWQRPFRAFYSDNTANNTLSAISFVFPQPTGVAPLLPSLVTNAPFFDLSGRRVLKPQPGQIMIQNGQKVMQ